MGGWLGGWVAGSTGNKATSAQLKLKLKLELSLAKLQICSIIRPYLMKNVDPPPILATLFSKQQIPPHIRVKFKETPPKLVEFHIHSPQNR